MDYKISVIIPIYNMGEYLTECLDSIFRQSLKEIEVIAVNDGSTDKSLLILEKYSHIYDNLVVITQENQGAGPAKNSGIRYARGRYLIFIDPDDYYPNNDCLEALYNAAEEHNVLMCGGVIMTNRSGKRAWCGLRILQNYYQNKMINFNEYPDIYGHTRYLYRTDLIRENNIYFPHYKRFEDQPFTMKAMACAGKFYALDKVVYEYRVGHKSVKYSLEVCRDILYGIRDVFLIAKENNLECIYRNSLKDIHRGNLISFYKYSFCGHSEIDNTIEEINEIVRKWVGDGEDVILEEDDVRLFRESSQHEYRRFMEILGNCQNKILYGAGVIVKEWIEQYQDRMQEILGIAVTRKEGESEENFAGFCIKEIEEYLSHKEDAVVIIGTSSIYHTEIEQNLKRLGFQYIVKPDYAKIRLGQSLSES